MVNCNQESAIVNTSFIMFLESGNEILTPLVCKPEPLNIIKSSKL